MIQQRTYFSPYDANSLQFFFRYEQTNARTEFLPHTHRWGQAIFGPAGAFEQKVTVSLFVGYLNRKFLHVYAI
ncbi:hypothetical protein ACQPT2_17730 [Erwinia amylovora]